MGLHHLDLVPLYLSTYCSNSFPFQTLFLFKLSFLFKLLPLKTAIQPYWFLWAFCRLLFLMCSKSETVSQQLFPKIAHLLKRKLYFTNLSTLVIMSLAECDTSLHFPQCVPCGWVCCVKMIV